MKLLICLLFAGCLLLSNFQFTSAAKVPEVTVKINGAIQTFDVAPIIKNGRVLVPFRKIFEVLGAKVTWDPQERMVTADKFGREVVLRIGDPTAHIIQMTTGKSFETPVKLEVPAEISNGRTLVPLRFVTESFDANVEWVAKEQMVLISTAEPAAFIPDKSLEQTIRNTLGMPNGPLTKEDLNKLDHLTITGPSVHVKGLEYATNLKYLFINANQVTNIEVLNSLSSLQELSLDNIQVTDIRFLNGLSQLQTLRISGMPVQDITSIGSLAELKTLSISRAPIQDIGPLSKLNQLEFLDLEQNQISDLAPLKQLTQLKRLSIYKNPVKDVAPLRDLKSLTHLSLADTQIADGTPITGLTNLQELGVPYSNLTNIEFAKDLTQLQILHVAGNQIQHLPNLSNLKHLHTLILDENPINDILSLTGHPSLQKLYVSNTKVSNITILTTLPSLKEVGLFQIPIDWSKNSTAIITRKQLEQNGVSVRL